MLINRGTWRSQSPLNEIATDGRLVDCPNEAMRRRSAPALSRLTHVERPWISRNRFEMSVYSEHQCL